MATMANGMARLDTLARKCFAGVWASCKARSFILPALPRWSLRRDACWLKRPWMKTIFGPKSLQVTNQWMELMIDCGPFVASQRISRDRRHLRGRCQPCGPVADGRGTGSGGHSGKTKTLPSARHLSDDGAVLELVDDWTRDVALVPATSESEASKAAA